MWPHVPAICPFRAKTCHTGRRRDGCAITPAHLAAIHEALGGDGAKAAALVQAYLLDRISGECQRWVDIRVPGAKEVGRWKVPSKGLPKDFAAALRDLYLLCVSSVTVRQRTAEWVRIMRETKG